MRGVLAAALALAVVGCRGGDTGASQASTDASQVATTGGPPIPSANVTVTIMSANGSHVFSVESARTEAEQAQGLMYRTDLKPDGGMLFWPYPPKGAPQVANFWMKNTPTPLDIVFIRADGTIARIAENTVPMSETMVPSGEPVGAVLELVGGRASALGIAEGDRVSWPGRR